MCIPTYNRTDLLVESIIQVINDERVSEIVIVDDASHGNIYDLIVGFFLPYPKVRLFKNDKNLDCYFNKREAVSKATNEYLILLDSDNVIGTDYLDMIYNQQWEPEKILQPCFAKPHFDFRKYSSLLVNKENVSKYVHDSTFTTALNAFNFFINRDKYLQVWNGSVNPVTSDSIYFNYCWLAAGNEIYFTPGLQYEHRVHDGSHYKNNVGRTPQGFHESIIKKLKELR